MREVMQLSINLLFKRPTPWEVGDLTDRGPIPGLKYVPNP